MKRNKKTIALSGLAMALVIVSSSSAVFAGQSATSATQVTTVAASSADHSADGTTSKKDAKKASREAAKASKQAAKANTKAALKLQQQTLKKNWASYTDAQKEQVYALKDAENNAKIDKLNAQVTAGHKTQEEVDAIVAKIQAKSASMRTSGKAPRLDSIVVLP